MGITRIKGPTEYSFAVWVKNTPFSGHPLDEDRFYSFAKTVLKYNSTNWLDFEFYRNKFKEYKLEKVRFKDIKNSHRRLLDYRSFYKASPTPGVFVNDTKFDQTVRIVKAEIIIEKKLDR